MRGQGYLRNVNLIGGPMWYLAGRGAEGMDWASLAGAAVVVAVVLVARLIRRKRETEMLDRIPGPPTLPLVGNLFDVAVSRDQVVKGLMKRRQDHGTIYRIWLGPIPIVHISKPKYIEVILNSSKHTRKGNFYRFLYPWLGTGLLTSSGKKWFDHRKLITPTFHFKILEGFVEVFAEHSEVLVRKLQEKAEAEEGVDVFPLVTLCALDIICETAMGIQLKSQSDDKSTYVASLNKISELTTERSNKLWLHPDIVFYNTSKGAEYNEHLKVVHGFTERVIRERKLRRQQHTRPPTTGRKAFLDLLLEASERGENQHLTERDIRQEVDTFMFEGHDTTTAAICWTLFSLGRNPAIQEELWLEQKAIFGARDSTPPSMQDLWEMKLLDRVIKESLRLYPSVSFISRRLEQEVTLGKYTIPADTTVCIDIINVHRNPSFFPDPEKFDPDRWLPENVQSRHPYSYIPFSAGPRNCIGQKFALLEEKVVLSFLLRNFRFEALQQPKQLTLTNELILRPLEGIILRMTKRLDFFSLILGMLVFVFFWKMSQNKKLASVVDKIPGPFAYPFVGNIFEMLEPRDRVLQSMMDRQKKFGPIFRVWLGKKPLILFSGPEYIEILLRSSKHSQKAFVYDFLHAWLGSGLLTSHGKKWAVHRKLITPTFHFQVLQSFIDTFQECSNVLVDKLNPKAETGEEFDLYSFITLCTLDIICETAMGTKVNAQKESHSQYVQSVYKLSELVIHRTSRLWLNHPLMFKWSQAGREFQKHLGVVHDFSNSVIRRRKEALKEKKKENAGSEEKKKMNFLDLLLEAAAEDRSSLLTDEELREEVDTFMFEGHDTTSAALSWVLALLGRHPEIQESCYQEVKAIFDTDPQRTPTVSDLAEMKLLERVIKEGLRLYPSVASIGRVVDEDTQFGEYLVPKGTNAMITIYAVHRNPKYYPDPDKFDPDRFLPENTLTRHPYAYLPFSAGPRNCIGQKFALYEEKVILSTLIRNFRFHSLDPVEEVAKCPDLVLKPKSEIRMRISKRV